MAIRSPMPFRVLRRRMAITSALLAASCMLAGSSARRNSGSRLRALAMLTLCLCPPRGKASPSPPRGPDRPGPTRPGGLRPFQGLPAAPCRRSGSVRRRRPGRSAWGDAPEGVLGMKPHLLLNEISSLLRIASPAQEGDGTRRRRTSPRLARSSVVFPLPDSPTMARLSPGATSMSAPFRASALPRVNGTRPTRLFVERRRPLMVCPRREAEGRKQRPRVVVGGEVAIRAGVPFRPGGPRASPPFRR